MLALGYILAGLFVGLAVGATGVGGGALMTPILIWLFGLTPAVAVGTDLLFAAGTKAFGVVLHGSVGTVNWRIVGRLAAGSLPATALTVWALNEVGVDESINSLIKASLGIAIGLTALGVIFRGAVKRFSAGERLSMLKGLHRRLQLPMTVASGAVLGVLVTLSSVGAGVIGATILLLLYPNLKAISVVGTDLAHAVPLTLLAGLGHMHLGTTDFGILALLLCGSLPGIYLGTRIGLHLPEHLLRPIIAGILLVVGIGLLVSA